MACGQRLLMLDIFITPQYRRLMKAEAVHKYKKRVDARSSLAERREEEEKGVIVDPLDDIFKNP